MKTQEKQYFSAGGILTLKGESRALDGNFPRRSSFYYIHTEKYSPKRCVVNFDTQMSSSQSEEWAMVFTREKNDTSNQNRERRFFTCEKNNTSNEKPQRCVSFAPKFPLFLAAYWAPLRTHSRGKVFLKEFFLVKKVKNVSEMEWIKVNHTMPKKTKRQV